jgi:methylenetetrahydrofolate reductase (NADPH)
LTAYPDRHPDKDLSEEEELDHLKAKIDAGADFIVTQLFYDVDGFIAWQERVRRKGTLSHRTVLPVVNRGEGIQVPIIPGVMPLQTYSSFLRLVKLCGMSIPETLTAALDPIRVRIMFSGQVGCY